MALIDRFIARVFLGASLGLGIGCAAGAAATPGDLDFGFDTGSGVTGAINATALQPDQRILLGGAFIEINGVPRGRIARLNLNGSLDLSFNPGTGASAPINAVVLQPDGKVLAVGDFTTFNGTTRAGLVRLNADGRLDASFNQGAGTGGGQSAFAAALTPDGKILLGGSFSRFNGRARSGLARLNGDGTLDESFDPKLRLWSIGQPLVYAIAVQRDGKILVGGGFDEISGNEQRNLARLNSDGNIDESFHPMMRTIGPLQIRVNEEGLIYVIGAFRSVEGEMQSGIARLLTNGLLDRRFIPRLPERPEMQAAVFRGIDLAPDGRVIIGGNIGYWNSAWGPQPYGFVLRLNPDGDTDATFQANPFPHSSFPAVLARVLAVTLLADGNIVVGGHFTSPRTNILRLRGGTEEPGPPTILRQPTNVSARVGQLVLLSVDGRSFSVATYQWRMNGRDMPGATNLTLQFESLHMTNRGSYSVMIRNDFGFVESMPALIEVKAGSSLPGSIDLTFNPGSGPNDSVGTIALPGDGKILIGGPFSEVNHVPREHVARLNSDGSLDSSFDARGGVTDPFINTIPQVRSILVQSDGKILIGGEFTGFAGVPRKGIARLNLDGSIDPSFDPQYFGPLWAIQPDDKVIIGNLLRLNPDGSLDASFDATLENRSLGSAIVRSVVIDDAQRIIAGGLFTHANNASRINLARFRPDGSLDTGFNAAPSRDIALLRLQAAKLITGEFFFEPKLARLNSDGTKDSTFHQAVLSGPANNPDAFLQALSIQTDGKIVLGGRFLTIDGTNRLRIARLHSDGILDATFHTEGGINGIFEFSQPAVYDLALQPDGKIVIAGQFVTVDGARRNFIARLHGGEAVEPRAPIISEFALTGNLFRVGAISRADASYFLELSDSLSSPGWRTVDMTSGDGTFKTLTDTNATGIQRFYRLRVE